nr:MAG TPA: hypothetical protein [Caudoviricetes sp.]
MPTKIKVGGCQLCRVRKQIALPGRLQKRPEVMRVLYPIQQGG